jgi:hypothetical protein
MKKNFLKVYTVIMKMNISEALVSIVRGSSGWMNRFVMQMQISHLLS